MTVTVPAGVAEGRYDLRVVATNQGRTDYINVPVTVAVDTTGDAAHESGPREWRARIGRIPVTVA